MQVSVHIAEEMAHKYIERGYPMLFSITWEHQGSFYPSKDWLDFGIVVLGWWLSTIDQFLEGGNYGTFTFMDGPYSIEVSLDRLSCMARLTPRGLNTVWQVSFTQLIEGVLSAAHDACVQLDQLNIGAEERNVLSAGITIIRRKMMTAQLCFEN